MQTMYPAVVNSPKTELVVAITETDTEIEVADVSVLLQPEGLAVIGNGEGAETIKYTEVEGNLLKNCIRGFQGTAKPWGAGTRLARNFTAYDHDAFMSNIEQHGTAISALEGRLDTADTVDITLQPGLQVVDAAKDARFNLGRIEGKTEINYEDQIGIIGVENPFVIGYGENLLPPFHMWDVVHSNSKLVGPYELSQITTTAGNEYNYCTIPAVENTFYSLQVVNTGAANRNLIQALDENKTQITVTESGGNEIAEGDSTNNRWIKTPAGTKYVRVYLYPVPGVGNSSTFKNPMLVIGSESKPFKPQRKSMIAFQTELHANPSDGSDPDVLFEKEGQYYKLAKWRKVILDGTLNWRMAGTVIAGAKALAIDGFSALFGGNSAIQQEVATKYNGAKLTVQKTGEFAAGDRINYSSGNGVLYLSVPNTDSGWGENYTPTADEIKAYFNGWKKDSANNRYVDFVNPDYWVTDVVRAASEESQCFRLGVYKPYQLLYRLAKEVVEPVPYEGSLVLPEGKSVVEVGTGIVVREGTVPAVGSTSAGINIIGTVSSPLKSKVSKILSIYRNGANDPRWTVVDRTDGSAYGLQRAAIDISLYSANDSYSVTYIKLDKSPIQPIKGVVADNEKAQISDLTAAVAEALQQVSVAKKNYEEKEVTGWITPTLLNGWATYNQAPSYLKDRFGFVHLKGRVSSGATTSGTVIFALPPGFRPGELRKFIVAVYPGSGSTSSGALNINYADGTITVDYLPGNGWVSLDNIVFLAEK